MTSVSHYCPDSRALQKYISSHLIDDVGVNMAQASVVMMWLIADN